MDDPLPVFCCLAVVEIIPIRWSGHYGAMEISNQLHIISSNAIIKDWSLATGSNPMASFMARREQKSNSLAFLGDVTVTVRLKTTKSQL